LNAGLGFKVRFGVLGFLNPRPGIKKQATPQCVETRVARLQGFGQALRQKSQQLKKPKI
jgi:hypothetical protein